MSAPWVADDALWCLRVQREAVRQAGPAMLVRRTSHVLAFQHSGIDVVGRCETVAVTVEFHQIPPYDCYGLAPEDYPRVVAEPGATSPHRMPQDGRLCLWSPFDPPENRWWAEDGLQSLLDLTARHLFAESYWRSTGGFDRNGLEVGIWPMDQAPHGIPRDRSASRRSRTPSSDTRCGSWKPTPPGGPR